MAAKFKKLILEFIDDTDGLATIWSIYMAVLFLIIGGLALDYTSAERSVAHLQATSDAIALAAVQDLPDEVQSLVTVTLARFGRLDSLAGVLVIGRAQDNDVHLVSGQ